MAHHSKHRAVRGAQRLRFELQLCLRLSDIATKALRLDFHHELKNCMKTKTIGNRILVNPELKVQVKCFIISKHCTKRAALFVVL